MFAGKNQKNQKGKAKIITELEFIKLSFETYPSLHGEWKDHYSCAVVEVIISPFKDFGLEVNSQIASQLLTEEGWTVVERISSTAVTHDELRELAEEVLQNGYAFMVNRVETVQMFLSDIVETPPSSKVLKKLSEVFLGAGELYSLYSEEEGQFANGVTPNGEEFLPIWSSKKLSRLWITHYESYSPRSISLSLYKEWIFPELMRCDMLLAVGCSDSHIATVHPKVLLDLVDTMC